MADETTPTPPAPAAPKPAAPAAPPAPPAKTVDEILQEPNIATAAANVRELILDAKEFAGEITLTVKRKQLRTVCQAFRDDGFDYLVDLTGVDYSKYPGHTGDRFAVAYMLYSHAKNFRFRLKLFVPDGFKVPSVTGIWKTANWHERETWDMFGIIFEGHPNLERILLWEGFKGHPLRKDFPLRGIDTGARIYPEVFLPGQGPKAGSTGKDPKDINIYKGDWKPFGISPVAPPAPATPKLPAPKDSDE